MATAAFRLSSAWVRPWTVAAAVVAAALVAFGVSVVLADNGGSRDEVAAYIEDASELLRSEAVEVDRLRFTYVRVRSNPQELPDVRDRLEDGRRALATLVVRVQRLEPPPDAAVLHARLVRLLQGQASFAGEVVALAAFLPVMATEERVLARAAARLRADLEETTPDAQAAAFARYASAVEAASERTLAAPVPRSLRPSRRAKAERLHEIAQSSRALGDALAAGEREDVIAAARRFGAATAASSVGVEREATLTYNRALRRVERLAAAVENERLRLSRELR